MTDEEKRAMVALMTDESSSSDVVTAYLAHAKNIVFELAFPHARYDGVQVDIAVELINKRGAEGETVHLENGISRHWEAGSISPSLRRRIIPYAGVPGKVQPEPNPEPEDEDDETGETEP